MNIKIRPVVNNKPTAKKPVISEEKQKKMMISQNKLEDETPVSNKYEGLSILGLVGDMSACGYYRVMNPLQLLKKMGADVHYSTAHNMSEFLKYKIILAPRQVSKQVKELLNLALWTGIHVIFEIDDDLNAVLPESPAYFAYFPGSPELEILKDIITMCDGMTTTTPEIARWYSQYNKNIAIIDNFIDFGFRDWGADVNWINGEPVITPKKLERPEDWGDKVAIMWAGGTTHRPDLKEFLPQLKRLLDERDDCIFCLYASPADAEWVKNEFGINPEKLKLVEARHFLDYPSGLHGADIFLGPLMPCQFNLAKSALKILEGLAVGAAFVGSNVGPYARFASQHPGMVNLVGNGKDCFPSFYSALKFLLDNPDELKRQKEEGRKFIYENYSLEKNIHRWPNSWMHIIKNKFEGKIGKPSLVKPKNYYKSFGVVRKYDFCPCGSGKSYGECCVDAFG